MRLEDGPSEEWVGHPYDSQERESEGEQCETDHGEQDRWPRSYEQRKHEQDRDVPPDALHCEVESAEEQRPQPGRVGDLDFVAVGGVTELGGHADLPRPLLLESFDSDLGQLIGGQPVLLRDARLVLAV